MTYQTKLLLFYWERLGYENHYLSSQCKHVERSSAGHPAEKPARATETEPSERTSTQSAANKKPVG
jgi:hypothetical protein